MRAPSPRGETATTAVGNDVVHLADPAIVDHYRRARFVERVCDAEERRRVWGSDVPHELLWSLYAAKEAAYKAVVKLRPGTVFAHRKFGVNAGLTMVCHDDLALRLRVVVHPEWVHAVASRGDAEPMAAVERMPPGADQSEAVRELATRQVAARFGLPREALSIARPPDPRERDRLAPPQLLLGGRPVPIDLSLSHDGPFAACAAVGQPDVSADVSR